MVDFNNRETGRVMFGGFLKFFGVWWLLSILGSLTFFGVIAYVAWHFISKFW